MITRKLMGLAALPLAGLLAGGGVAMAQTSGTPTNTQVTQQMTPQQERQQTQAQQRDMVRDDSNCDGQQVRQQTQSQDRDRDGSNCGNQQAKTAAAGDRLMQQARDGSCLED